MAKKACVCGAGGFVGGWLTKRLLDEGYAVRAVDVKPFSEWWQTHDEAFSWSCCDLRVLEDCRNVVKDVDEVYQLAAQMGGAGIVFSGGYDAEIMHDSAQINLNIAEMARERKFRTFYSSSACVYPAYNQTDPMNPNCEEGTAYPAACDSNYGWEKIFSERLYESYSRNHGLDVRVARFHNVMGPCYDDKTEILTEGGFKAFADVSYDDLIATRTSDGEIEYHHPLAIQSHSFSGELFEFHSRSYNFAVTPEHELTLLTDRNGTSLSRVTAENVARHPHELFVTRRCLWRGRERSDFEIPGFRFTPSMPFQRRNRNGTVATIQLTRTKKTKVVAMDDWLEFLGWYISEGCSVRRRQKAKTETQGENFDHIVDIRNFDPQNLRDIAAVIRRLGYHPIICDGRVQVSSKALYTLLRPLGKSGVKYIPDEIRRLSARQLRILLTSLSRGDGTIVRGVPATYQTKSPRLADHVSEIAMKCGFGVTVNFRPARPEKRASEQYYLSFSREHLVHQIEPENISRISYSGLVYDVTVPNHTIMVRRNGRSAWCGNCGSWKDGREKAPAAICRKVATAKLTGDHRIEIWGSGAQTRSFCWIEDCIRGILDIMRGDNPAPVNLGSAEMVTINQLVDYVEEIAGIKLERRYNLDAPKGVAGRNSDNTEFKRRYGWEPKTSLRYGLDKTYAWIEQQVKQELSGAAAAPAAEAVKGGA